MGIVLGQLLLFIREMEDLIGKVGLALVDDGIDVPDLRPAFIRLGLRIIRDRPGFAGAGEGVEVAHLCTQGLFQVSQGDVLPVLALGGTVLADKSVGIAHQIVGIGIDDLIVVTAGLGKVVRNPLFHIINALSKNLIDGKGDLVGIFNDGSIVVHNGLGIRIRGAAEQAAENNGGEHEDEQHRQQQDHDDHNGNCSDVFPGPPDRPGYCAIGAADSGALRRPRHSFSGLDHPADHMCSIR